MANHVRPSRGFTVIELVVVIVVLCILGTVVAVTYRGVQADNRDNQRQTDVDVLQSQLETHYARFDRYPSLTQLNDPTWRAENLQGLKEDKLQDPQWAPKGGCSKNDKATLTDLPAPRCYSYQITSADGQACDNDKIVCGKYTLTATLESGETYVKSSLN